MLPSAVVEVIDAVLGKREARLFETERWGPDLVVRFVTGLRGSAVLVRSPALADSGSQLAAAFLVGFVRWRIRASVSVFLRIKLTTPAFIAVNGRAPSSGFPAVDRRERDSGC